MKYEYECDVRSHFNGGKKRKNENNSRKKPNEWNLSVKTEEVSFAQRIMEDHSVDNIVRFGVSAVASRQSSFMLF